MTISIFKKCILLLLSFLLDSFLFLHMQFPCTYIILILFLHTFFEHNFFIFFYTQTLLIFILSFLFFQSITFFPLVIFPWLTLVYFLYPYMGRKDIYLYITFTLIIITQQLLLSASLFKSVATAAYTCKLIVGNLMILYAVLLKFPIVERGNRL